MHMYRNVCLYSGVSLRLQVSLEKEASPNFLGEDCKNNRNNKLELYASQN